MNDVAAVGTSWQTFGHDDMRTGASTVSALITNPTLAWVAGSAFGGQGSAVTGSGMVVAPGNVGAQTHELSNTSGIQLAAFGVTSYASQNAVTLNPVIDGSGYAYITNNQTTVKKVGLGGMVAWTTLRPDFSDGINDNSSNDNITTDPFVPNAGGLDYVVFGAASPDSIQGMIYIAGDTDGALTPQASVLGRPIAISSNAAGTTLYVRTTIQGDDQHSYIYVFEADETGLTEIRHFQAGGPFIQDGYGAITVNPTGNIYYMTWNGILVEANPSTGNTVATAYVGNQPYSNINLDSAAGIIYVSGGGTIHAFDLNNSLAPLWNFSTQGNALFTAPALAISTGGASALYFVTTTGTLYSVNAQTGVKNWDVNLQTILGQPAGAKIDSSTIIDSLGNIIYTDLNYGAVAITNFVGGGNPPLGP